MLLLLLLLLLASLLEGAEAAPTPQKFQINGTWRADPGETVTLRCEFLWRSSASPSSYEWIKDGEVIPGETRDTLTFSPVTTQDTGIYLCGDPTSNLERLEHDLYVSGARLPQPVIRMPGVQVLGRSFAMECVILRGYIHNDRNVFTWYKDDTEIQGQSSRVLRFSRVRDADEGKYTCTVREAAEETTSPPSVYYYLHPLVSPELRIRPASPDNVTKGILGENLTLTCEVTRAFPGVPADGFSWSYLPSPQGQRRPLVGKASTLTLGPLTREDGGQYFCQARNDQDLQQFKDLNLIGHTSTTVHIVYLKNITLTSDLEVKKVKKGDPVTLICSVDSQPAARLVWIVHGQEVRYVTLNLDYYVIPRADCSDSTSYTCRASNTDLPGWVISASTRVHVQSCSTGSVTSNTTAEIAVIFDFRLPDKTPLVVVHPRGQDILTVQPDWFFNISSAFLPRLLHPRCDPAQHLLSFTLTKVTEEDEGSYTVMEEGERERKPRLAQELRLTRAVQEGAPPVQSNSFTGTSIVLAATWVCLVLGVAVFLVKYRHQLFTRVRKFFTARQRRQGYSAPPGDNISSREVELQMEPLMQTQRDIYTSYEQENQSAHTTGESGSRRRKPAAPSLPQQKSTSGSRRLSLRQGGVEHFQALYSRGRVYVIPPLPDCPAQQRPLAGGQADLDTRGLEGEEAKLCVLRLLWDLLKKRVRPADPPVFVFTQALPCSMHAIIYHSQLGVIIVKTEAVSKSDFSSILTTAAKELEKARDKVTSQLRGLLGPEALTLLLALPNLENKEDVKETVQRRQSIPDIQLLFGRKEADFEAWLQKLFKRQDHTERVWRRRTKSYQNFVTAVSRYLYLEGYSGSQKKGGHSRLLASPEQAAVLHCSDKRLHICGPPGSGKSLLALDRVRWWLERGKTVVVAVCTPHFLLLLHRFAEEFLHGLTPNKTNRMTLCCNVEELQKTLRELGQQPPPSSVCVFIDNLDSQMHPVFLEASRSAAVECVWTAGQRDLPAPVSTQLQSLGGRSVRLSLPLQCHPDLLPLARELLPPGPLTPHLTDPPCMPAHPPPASVKVTLHHSHPDYKALEQDSSAFACQTCSQWLTSSLSPLEERLPLEHERWRHWVILMTGDWGLSSPLMTKLVTWLRQQGVPAVQEWKSDTGLSSLPESSLVEPSRDQQSEVSEDETPLQERVLYDVDSEGRSAVHVMPASHFTGLEKARVLVVHYDWRDDHPYHQSQEQRDARLFKHRDQLFQAVTRCQTELAVWLLSPSPAASLLQGHVVERREEQPAGTPEATGAAEQTARLAHQADKQDWHEVYHHQQHQQHKHHHHHRYHHQKKQKPHHHHHRYHRQKKQKPDHHHQQ